MSSIPSDPADLFSHLYDELDVGLFDTAEVLGWMSRPAIQDIAELVEERVVISGRLEPSRVEELLELAGEDEIQERVFAILLGLDRALSYANPLSATYDQAGLLPIAVRYAMTGRLNTSAVSGALLPRCAFPGSSEAFPNRLADVFASVVRVSAEAMSQLVYRRLPPLNDLTRAVRGARPMIGCVALLDQANELTWKTLERDDHRFYRICVRDTPELRQRMTSVLDALDQSGVSIALMPELTLDQELVTFWVELVRSRPAPSDSRLKWLLVGTGATTTDDPPVNEALIIDRITGDEVLRQRKLHRFTLTEEQLREWALVDLLGARPVTEDLTLGRSITVIESNLGRIAVLVCEDLARLMDVGPWLRAAGISHIFAPVFSKETKPHHWEHTKAKEYANETGAEVVVANSLVVARRMGEIGRTMCFLAHSPDATRHGVVGAPDELCLF